MHLIVVRRSDDFTEDDTIAKCLNKVKLEMFTKYNINFI